jgi:TPR repeat protein
MAQMDLYRLYANGAAGIRKNLALATRWLATASDLDHIPASFLLGQHYERGQGLARNYEQAADLYQKASDKDHLAATLALANLYERGRGVEKDQDQALVLLIKAQSLGAEALERRIARLKKKRSS